MQQRSTPSAGKLMAAAVRKYAAMRALKLKKLLLQRHAADARRGAPSCEGLRPSSPFGLGRNARPVRAWNRRASQTQTGLESRRSIIKLSEGMAVPRARSLASDEERRVA